MFRHVLGKIYNLLCRAHGIDHDRLKWLARRLPFSQHAIQRASERRIKFEEAAAALIFGDRTYDPTAMKLTFELTPAAVRRASGRAVLQLRPGLCVVVSDGLVVTVFWRAS